MLVAGYGVTAKVIMIVTLIGIGSGSGVQPFLGYCYGAKEKERLAVVIIMMCRKINKTDFAGPEA